LPSPLPQEREQSAAAVSDSLKAAAVSTESSLPPGKSNLHGQIQQQPAPSPVGEGWGEGKAVAAQSAIAVITESDLYQYVARSRVHNRRKKHAAVSDGLLRDLAEINIGDPVVHEEHGIGRYMGLVTMDLGGETNEMMLLEYAGEAQLYVPVSQLHLISRYSGQAHENIALHKLGSGAWNKAKRKAAEKARDTAAELLNLYARRAAQSGHKFEINELDYQAFADGFGYEETEDQAAAIAAVIKDLTQAKPMDRLVCGDVGFGKTEVALRAAFVAVMGGKQVAVLAPTTLLVEQHAQNFADRFADFPVKVASLSRFNNSKATKAALEGMADGTVDIVIGTHKLVQDDIKFKNLGLVIIDEEHRFGVRQKEQLKRLRANVDILTMTATPIPRTLSMALEGLRDFSLITTAPSRRLAVKTFVKPFSEGSVREAVLRELKRGGQVFFLHNEVDTIENMRERLETLLPEARIGVAHGQLRERELEQVMRDFLQQRFNVLLCSTIIETGIDIPNANTIIINRADKFGLAQLHQLRGRVGRSHHQAYAYLLTPEYITKDAEKRLDAIAAADELGAGFTLAMQDLEIRGAGEILGEGQSGEMIQVGFTLYTEMLKQAVRDLKKGRQPDLDAPLGITTEIKLHSPALLPESYCPDIHERLVLYKRLAVCETVQQINAIHEELVDRFGLPEQPVKTLIESHHLRLMAKELGIDAIDAAGEAVTVTFGKNNNVDPTEIILLIQNDKKYRLAGADKLRFTAEMENIEVRINTVKNVLKTLQNRCLPK
ncbi:transcription-repair coupling factor, partial [Neisseria meningitidis]